MKKPQRIKRRKGTLGSSMVGTERVINVPSKQRAKELLDKGAVPVLFPNGLPIEETIPDGVVYTPGDLPPQVLFLKRSNELCWFALHGEMFDPRWWQRVSARIGRSKTDITSQYAPIRSSRVRGKKNEAFSLQVATTKQRAINRKHKSYSRSLDQHEREFNKVDSKDEAILKRTRMVADLLDDDSLLERVAAKARSPRVVEGLLDSIRTQRALIADAKEALSRSGENVTDNERRYQARLKQLEQQRLKEEEAARRKERLEKLAARREELARQRAAKPMGTIADHIKAKQEQSGMNETTPDVTQTHQEQNAAAREFLRQRRLQIEARIRELEQKQMGTAETAPVQAPAPTAPVKRVRVYRRDASLGRAIPHRQPVHIAPAPEPSNRARCYDASRYSERPFPTRDLITRDEGRSTSAPTVTDEEIVEVSVQERFAKFDAEWNLSPLNERYQRDEDMMEANRLHKEMQVAREWVRFVEVQEDSTDEDLRDAVQALNIARIKYTRAKQDADRKRTKRLEAKQEQTQAETPAARRARLLAARRAARGSVEA